MPQDTKKIIPAENHLGAPTTQEPSRGADLPPAGYTYNETMQERTDDLQQKAEERSEAVEQYAVDPKALRPIREIQHAFGEFNELHISGADSAYHYCWANCHSGNGLFVRYKLAEGWEVVSGDKIEAAEHRHVDGTRRVGDVLLMRMRLDHWIGLERRRKAKNDRSLEAVSSNLRDMGERYRDKGVIVHTPEDGTMDEKLLKRMETNAQAQSKAGKMVDGWMREGRMPGVRAPGAK